MKLTKAVLIKKVKSKLNHLGYIEFKDSINGTNGLFIKQIDEDNFLSLGLVISKFYDSLFSASYYLSRTTRWGTMYGDIPRESYQRISTFLNINEKSELLSKEYLQEGINDAWWNGLNNQDILNFIRTVEITESRFTSQTELKSKISESIDIRELKQLASEVLIIINQDQVDSYKYDFVPDKPIDDIPEEWFKTAEKVICNYNGILNSNTVKLLAADAWRQNELKNKL